MSNAASGASTPRTGSTPPPTDGPNPLALGSRFVAQYYNTLSNQPDQLIRFYQPASYLSQGMGSQATIPVQCNKESVNELKERFYIAKEGVESGKALPDGPIRIELEQGAIDAQTAMNGGILLVVTGSIVYPDIAGGAEKASLRRRKAFVHTFILGSIAGKRNYYVQNDVLRFLHGESLETEVVASKTTQTEPITAVDAPVETINHTQPTTKDEVLDEAPGGGVEESKDTTMNEAAQDTFSEPGLEGQNGDHGPPGSWASMVARSGGSVATSTASAPSTPVRAAAQPAKKAPKAAPKQANNNTSSGSNANSQPKPNRTNRREPDCTLVIKNIAEGASSQDLLSLFEPFVGTAKVVGTTVSVQKGIAFIDYDSPEPVLAAVKQHEAVAFSLNDRVLDVYQKTLENRSRRGNGERGFRGGPNGSRGGGRGRIRGGGRGGRGRGEHGGR